MAKLIRMVLRWRHGAHPFKESTPSLAAGAVRGFRKNTARTLKEVAGKVTRKNAGFLIPSYPDRLQLSALISKHIT